MVPVGNGADQEGRPMAKFMDVHEGFVGITSAQFDEAHSADLKIEADEGVHFERAWLDPEAGKVFCLSTGPSKEAIMRIHQNESVTSLFQVKGF